MKNIDIRNLAGIRVADVDVYKTNKRKQAQLTYNKGTVQFYRSIEQSISKFGKEDQSYLGQFGYDLYNNEYCPKDSIKTYYDLTGNFITTDSSEYICPYISIWPKSINLKKGSITLYPVMSDESKILEFLEYECKELEDNQFKKNTTKITVTKTPPDPKKKDDRHKILIQCTEFFDNDICIIAKYDGKPIGRIIAKANSKIFQTEIQPIRVKFADVQEDTIEDLNIGHDKFIKEKLLPVFNGNSFNQTYIIGTLAKTTKLIVLKKSNFSKLIEETKLPSELKELNSSFVDGYYVTDKSAYHNSLERKLAYLLDPENLKRQKIKDQISKVIIKIINTLKNDFQYGDKVDLKKAKSFYDNKIATSLWNKPETQTYIKEYEELKKEFTGDVFLNKNKKVYIFYTEEVEGMYRPPRDIVQAFSANESCTCHIFNNAIKDEKALKLIIHELGHSFGLQHTFPQWAKDSITETQKNIEEKKVKKQELVDAKLQASFELKDFFGIDKVYREMSSVLEAVDPSKVSILSFEYYFIAFFTGKYTVFKNGESKTYVENFDILKIESKQIELPKEDLIEKKQKEIEEDEKELKELESALLTQTIERSKTLENYMDYSQKSTGQFQENFEYKSYFHWQWSKIINFASNSISFKNINNKK